MEIIGLASLIALAWKIVDFAKFIRARDWNATATQAATWAAGIVVVLLAAEADVTAHLTIGDVALTDVNTASRLLIGLSLLSLGSVGFDFKKAIDSSDSAHTPSLLPPARSHGLDH